MTVSKLSWCLVFLVAFVTPVSGTPQGPLSPALELSVDTSFPLLGGTATFTLTGPPDASYLLLGSPEAAETLLPAWGNIYVNLDKMKTFANGTLSPTGEATILVPVPDSPTWDGRMLFFQAAATVGADKGVSQAIPVRPSSTSPSGARQPEAISVTPDGTRAYVLHEEDGTVSVLDAVTDTLLFDRPVGPVAESIGLPLEMAIDPEGRHLFIVDPRRDQIIVIDAASASPAGSFAIPLTSRDIAFDFNGGSKRVFITNEREGAVLVYSEAPAGTFSLTDKLILEGSGPGAIARLDDGTLVVGHRVTHELEVIDPSVTGGATLARTPLARLPWDIEVVGDRVFIPTFTVRDQPDQGDGDNVVLEWDAATRQILITDHLLNLGTDYVDAKASDQHLAIVAGGSGVVMLSDVTTLAWLETIDLNPGGSVTYPQRTAFVASGGGSPAKLYVVNHFRETVRPIDLQTGPPFALLPEIPLAWSGSPRDTTADLSDIERGEWFYSTVAFFNGTAQTPNRVTCNTCHPHTFASGLVHPNIPDSKQAQSLFDTGGTGPWMWEGTIDNLISKTEILFNAHGTVGGPLSADAKQGLVLYQDGGTEVPTNPNLLPDGSLSAAAEAGKLVFEGAAACSSCHEGPLFIPVPPDPATIPGGVGTGLVPANVPSLRGIWASAPYLWDGAAPTLMDVLTITPLDEHGTTSTLTQQELDDLVAYLESI